MQRHSPNVGGRTSASVSAGLGGCSGSRAPGTSSLGWGGGCQGNAGTLPAPSLRAGTGLPAGRRSGPGQCPALSSPQPVRLRPHGAMRDSLCQARGWVLRGLALPLHSLLGTVRGRLPPKPGCGCALSWGCDGAGIGGVCRCCGARGSPTRSLRCIASPPLRPSSSRPHMCWLRGIERQLFVALLLAIAFRAVSGGSHVLTAVRFVHRRTREPPQSSLQGLAWRRREET